MRKDLGTIVKNYQAQAAEFATARDDAYKFRTEGKVEELNDIIRPAMEKLRTEAVAYTTFAESFENRKAVLDRATGATPAKSVQPLVGPNEYKRGDVIIKFERGIMAYSVSVARQAGSEVTRLAEELRVIEREVAGIVAAGVDMNGGTDGPDTRTNDGKGGDEDPYFKKSSVGNAALAAGVVALGVGGTIIGGKMLIGDAEDAAHDVIDHAGDEVDEITAKLERRIRNLQRDLMADGDEFITNQLEKLRSEIDGLTTDQLAKLRDELNAVYDELSTRLKDDLSDEQLTNLNETLDKINDVLNSDDPAQALADLLNGNGGGFAENLPGGLGDVPGTLQDTIDDAVGGNIGGGNTPNLPGTGGLNLPGTPSPGDVTGNLPVPGGGVQSDLSDSINEGSVNTTVPVLGASRVPSSARLPSAMIDFSQLSAKIALARQSGRSDRELRAMCPREGAALIGKKPTDLTATEQALIDSKCSELLPDSAQAGDFASGYAQF